ncbi:MAG: Scr1 family TA system antitoxin-like transcriptional regulator [Pseudonocardiaceae bacterium]
MGSQLRRLRHARDLTAKQVGGDYLDCSESLLYSVENGTRVLGRLALLGLVRDVYGREDLAEPMARLLPNRSDRSEQSPSTCLAHDLATMATDIRGFVVDQIPELLQAPGYALAQYRAAGYSERDAGILTESRLDRQARILELDEPPMSRVIVTQGAIDRARTIRGQLGLIQARSRHPSIQLVMVPHTAGPHFSFASYAVITIDPLDPVLHLSTAIGDGPLVDDPDDVRLAISRWESTARLAMSESDTADYIANVM